MSSVPTQDHCAREGAVVILFATRLRTLRLKKPELLSIGHRLLAFLTQMLYLRTT